MRKLPKEGDLHTVQLELLKDMFISQLALAGVGQLEISKIVRVNLNRVNRIGKSLKKGRKNMQVKSND